MEVEIRLESGRKEPKVVILAGEDSGELRRLAESLSRLSLGPIPVSGGEEKLLLPQGEFLRFYTDGKGVSAQTGSGTYGVPLRLYELEERCPLRPHLQRGDRQSGPGHRRGPVPVGDHLHDAGRKRPRLCVPAVYEKNQGNAESWKEEWI